MKKILTICIPLTMAAQLFAQKGLYFGLNYIPQKSTLYNKNDLHRYKAEPDKNINFHFPTNYNSGGIVIGYSFTHRWGLELNVISSHQGQKYSAIMGDSADPSTYSGLVALQAKLANENIKGPFEASVNLNCLKIPFMFRLTSDNSKRFFATFHAGPQINILRKVKQEINGVNHEYPGLGVEPKNLYKKITLDGVLAIGLGINLLKNFTITAQARGDLGLQSLEKKKITYVYQGQTYHFFGEKRTGTHNGTLGIAFGLNYKL